MGDNAQARGLLETLLEQEKARMQATLDQQFQGFVTRLRDSITSCNDNTERRITSLQNDLEMTTQRNLSLQTELNATKEQLDAAKEKLDAAKEQTQAANERANISETHQTALQTDLLKVRQQTRVLRKDLEIANGSVKKLKEHLEVSAKAMVDKFVESTTQVVNSLAGEQTKPEASLPMPDQDQESRDQDDRGLKRKASTERPRSSEAGLEADRIRSRAPEPANMLNIVRLNDVKTNSTFNAGLQRVSTAKIPDTLDRSWTTMISNEVRITHKTATSFVTRLLEDFRLDPDTDTVVLRVWPVSDTEKGAFGRVFDSLVNTGTCGSLASGIGRAENVRNIYIVPILKNGSYPESFKHLDQLTPKPTENMLLLAVVFEINEKKQKEVRQAWDDLMMAVHSSGVYELAHMRDTVLIGHPLPICRSEGVMLSSVGPLMNKLGNLPTTQAICKAKLGRHQLYHITYTLIRKDWRRSRKVLMVDVKLPICVFVLGETTATDGSGNYFFVDMMAPERHLWGFYIFGEVDSGKCCGRLRLVRNKFPRSLKEWDAISMETWKNGIPDKDFEVDLKLRRYT